MSRGFVALFVVALAASPVWSLPYPGIDLDPRIRPHPETGALVLPGPVDGDGLLSAAPAAGDCDMAYLSCEPHVPCAGDGPCCPEVLTPGLAFRVGNPFFGPTPPSQRAQVRVTAMAGGACYGQGTQHVRFSFLPPVDEVLDCFYCALAAWFGDAGIVGFLEFLGLDCSGTSAPIGARGGAPRAGQPGLTETLRALRDQVMAASAAGRHYAELYATHSPELIRAVPRRPWMLWELADGLLAWEPGLRALVAGQGSSVTITPAMVQALETSLDELEAAAAAGTVAAIRAERTRIGLGGLTGLTMDEARARVEASFDGGAGGGGGGGGGDAGDGCGSGFAGADCALAELQRDDLCGATPLAPKLLRRLESRAGQARAVLARAGRDGLATQKLRRLVARVGKQLAGLRRAVGRSRGTDASCRSTIDQMIAERAQRVALLAPS